MSVSDWRGAGRRIRLERGGRDWSKNVDERPTDMDNGGGLTGSGGGLGGGGQRGKNWDNCNIVTIKI